VQNIQYVVKQRGESADLSLPLCTMFKGLTNPRKKKRGKIYIRRTKQ